MPEQTLNGIGYWPKNYSLLAYSGPKIEMDKPWRKFTKCQFCKWYLMCNMKGYTTNKPVPICDCCEDSGEIRHQNHE